MTQSSILVTGGAGFIGSHTCKMLAAEGYVPVSLDNLSTGNREDVQWGPFVHADVRDTDRVSEAIRTHRVKAVLHFAASAYVGESVEKPALYYDNNIKGILSLLEACRATDVDNVIFSSSCATYGIPETLPITEAAEQRPINPYGRTKLIGEQILRDFSQAYGIRHVILRYFNACGADPDGQLSEKHRPETHLIPLALMAAGANLPHLEVFGDDYDTADGTCVRDYIHVCDLADGHVRALRHLEGQGGNLAVNLGSGKGHSILEVVAAVLAVTGREVPLKLGPRRQGDPPILLADPANARRELGFEARFSDIETIIRHTAPTFGLEVSDVGRG